MSWNRNIQRQPSELFKVWVRAGAAKDDRLYKRVDALIVSESEAKALSPLVTDFRSSKNRVSDFFIAGSKIVTESLSLG